MAVWLATAACLVVGWMTLPAAFVNVALCRYFFIHMRWKSVLRGMGAPGFMTYWLGVAVCLLEYTAQHAPSLRPLALLAMQVDLALIMLSAGVYKFTAGYPQNHGMELGMGNPMWGYWWTHYVRRAPGHLVFRTLNQLAWATEVGAALLMLWPRTREIGGLLLGGSFLFILTHIRLGFLCEMVVVAGLLFVPTGGAIDHALARVAPEVLAAPAVSGTISGLDRALGVGLWLYLVLLPLSHAGLFVNFYGRRRLPGILQTALERYTNAFGIIIWRVFSVDLVNFFIQPCVADADGTRRTPVAAIGSWPRFNHVGEMICLASLFTTLKYYPSQDARFRDRVVRYARTLPRGPNAIVVFEYFSAVKHADRFEWRHVADYAVDPARGAVEERMLDAGFSPRAAHTASPVHEGMVPGSYAPARSK
jgi:hypothetical protein